MIVACHPCTAKGHKDSCGARPRVRLQVGLGKSPQAAQLQREGLAQAATSSLPPSLAAARLPALCAWAPR